MKRGRQKKSSLHPFTIIALQARSSLQKGEGERRVGGGGGTQESPVDGDTLNWLLHYYIRSKIQAKRSTFKKNIQTNFSLLTITALQARICLLQKSGGERGWWWGWGGGGGS